jgi:predicted dehydrogenase
MKKRDFLKISYALLSSSLIPSSLFASLTNKKKRVRTAHIGVGQMGAQDLNSIASHKSVDVIALCDVDSNAITEASKLYPKAKTYKDYRKMLKDIAADIDAVIVSTPDHTHGPASIMAMKMNKPVYCQKPLTHLVSEAREMKKLSEQKNLITQMGIQVHSFYDYKLATILIQGGIIGKVNTVRAWTNSDHGGYDGPTPKGNDPIPESLDWNLWLGTSPERPYKKNFYHPGEWRKLIDYGCGTFGDMGVHIFDTPYNALKLDAPLTIKSECRKPNGYSFPKKNRVTYKFPGTAYTTSNLTWTWSDGHYPLDEDDLILPNQEELPMQGSMFIGEKGRLLLPHFMEAPRLIVDDNYKKIDTSKYSKAQKIGKPIRKYDIATKIHYHEFIDACLGKDKASAPFSYSSRLTETILLGLIAGRFPNKILHWDNINAKFKEDEANQYLSGSYRNF